jgi:hypothetical protein
MNSGVPKGFPRGKIKYILVTQRMATRRIRGRGGGIREQPGAKAKPYDHGKRQEPGSSGLSEH